MTEDGRAFLKGLNKKNPTLFDGFYLPQKEAFLAEPGPVWSWRTTIPRRRDGAPVDHISSISFGPNDPPRPLAKGAYMVSNIESGRLNSPVRIDTATAIVVINAAAVDGVNLQQLAAYCTMVGLSPANTRHAQAAPGSSILSLFPDAEAAGDAPKDLSGFDLAYLRSLYLGDTGYSFEQKTRAMAISMERQLTGAKR